MRERGTFRADGVRAVHTFEVIATVALVGSGVDGDPAREVIELWFPTGEPVATLDPLEATLPPIGGPELMRSRMGTLT